MRHALALAGFLAVSGCTERIRTAAPPPTLPQYEQELLGVGYHSSSFGDWSIVLEFDRDERGLLAVLSRDDGLHVTFDAELEFFPFSTSLPRYLLLTPRDPWEFLPYQPTSPQSYPVLFMDCYLYTQGGNVWPPSGMDNLAQTDPVWPLLFFRIW